MHYLLHIRAPSSIWVNGAVCIFLYQKKKILKSFERIRKRDIVIEQSDRMLASMMPIFVHAV